MATHRIKIGMGEGAVAGAPHILLSVGIGSCVVVTLYDEERRIGGMAHVMLPDSEGMPKSDAAYQCADTAIDALLHELSLYRAEPANLEAKITGGAKMFSSYDNGSTGMGGKNLRSIKDILSRKCIPLVGWDIAGHHGRIAELHLNSGLMVVKASGMEDRSF